MSLAKKTTVGVLWNFAEQISRRGIQVVVTLLLAYFLSPEDFGLVSMFAVFVALGTSLMDSGFKEALVRLNAAKQIDFDTAFYSNIMFGLISYFILFIAAPYIAEFYNEPKLTSLVRVVSLVIIINSLKVVQVSKLSREMNFKTQLKVNVPAAFISGVSAVVLAYLGFGVWTLILQMLIYATLVVIMLWKQKIYKPSLSFSKKSFLNMYGFGYKLFLSGVLDIIFNNIYVILIAKYFSIATVGLYFFADRIRDIVVLQLLGAIRNVTYPALSTMQNDNERLKKNYRKIVKIMTFILFPVILFLAALSDNLFQALLPEKWLEASTYLSIMLVAWVLMPMHSINVNILKVKGRSDLFLYLEIIKKMIAIIVIALSMNYGIYGLLIGQIVGSIVAYIPNVYFTNKVIDYSISEQIRDFSPALFLAGIITFMIYGMQNILEWNVFLELVVFGVGAVSIFIFAAFIMKLEAYELTKDLLMEKMRK